MGQWVPAYNLDPDVADVNRVERRMAGDEGRWIVSHRPPS